MISGFVTPRTPPRTDVLPCDCFFGRVAPNWGPSSNPSLWLGCLPEGFRNCTLQRRHWRLRRAGCGAATGFAVLALKGGRFGAGRIPDAVPFPRILASDAHVCRMTAYLSRAKATYPDQFQRGQHTQKTVFAGRSRDTRLAATNPPHRSLERRTRAGALFSGRGSLEVLQNRDFLRAAARPATAGAARF